MIVEHLASKDPHISPREFVKIQTELEGEEVVDSHSSGGQKLTLNEC